MLAVVKKPRIELSLTGCGEDLQEMLGYLRAKYEVDVVNHEPAFDGDEAVEFFESDFWKENAAPGRIVAGFRLKHQLTQAQLAEMTGINQANIAAYENGKRPLTQKAAARIGAALGEAPEKFFRHCPPRKKPCRRRSC